MRSKTTAKSTVGPNPRAKPKILRNKSKSAAKSRDRNEGRNRNQSRHKVLQCTLLSCCLHLSRFTTSTINAVSPLPMKKAKKASLIDADK